MFSHVILHPLATPKHDYHTLLWNYESVLNLFDNTQLNHHTQVTGGVLAEECVQELQAFFEMRRNQQKASKASHTV